MERLVYSPNGNSIQYLWANLRRKVISRLSHLHTSQELQVSLIEGLAKIFHLLINSLIDSKTQRFLTLVRGNHTLTGNTFLKETSFLIGFFMCANCFFFFFHLIKCLKNTFLSSMFIFFLIQTSAFVDYVWIIKTIGLSKIHT